MKAPITTSLCAWCYCADWGGGCCEDANLICRHPLEVVSENSWDVWQGGDCWGFRPDVAREDAVDICGLGLQGKWVDMNSFPKIRKPIWHRRKAKPVDPESIPVIPL